MTLFMGAHNQELMFARSMDIMYLLEGFQVLTTDRLHGLQKRLLLNHSTLAHWSVCFQRVLKAAQMC